MVVGRRGRSGAIVVLTVMVVNELAHVNVTHLQLNAMEHHAMVHRRNPNHATHSRVQV